MNIPLLQKIDRWAGVPLCFLLTLARKVIGRSPPPGAAAPRSILFIKLAEQGSTVLAGAAIARAVAMAGRQNVFFITFQENRLILDLLQLIPEENVITVCRNSLPELVSSTWRAMRRMRRLKLDAAIDMEFFSRGSAVVSCLSGAPVRVGFHAFFGAGPYRGDLMTHRVLYNPHLHTSATFQVLVEALGTDPARLPTLDFAPPTAVHVLAPFTPRPEETAVVRAMLLGGPLILLNPNASDLLPLRRWPGERYVDLAKRLLAQFPEAQLGFTGAPEEAAETERLVREVNSKRCICLGGRTTLRQLMVLYTLAEILVTNDSGPAHFAALTPIHVITLFGPETPALFAARTPRHQAIWLGLGCSPCVSAYNNRQSPCRDNVCMKQITVEQVFQEVCKIYARRRSAA
ncbi:MAG: glycosyltransferase family 9 protein [Limisphaerales bacterium]